MIQCRKFYILCFVSTKYISFVTENIICTSLHCSDVELKLYVSWVAYKNMIQCQKIYILCFVSTKYISVDTEYIVSTTAY